MVFSFWVGGLVVKPATGDHPLNRAFDHSLHRCKDVSVADDMGFNGVETLPRLPKLGFNPIQH